MSVEPLGPARVWSAGKGREGGAFKGGKKRGGFVLGWGAVKISLALVAFVVGGGVAVAAQRPPEPPAAGLLCFPAKPSLLPSNARPPVRLTRL